MSERSSKRAPVRNAQAKDERQAFPLAEAFGCAFAGVCEAFRTQRNMKIQVGFGVAAIILGFLFRVDAPAWLAIVICIGVVLGFECVNTSIESTIDLVQPEYHPLARIAKDCAAGATLCASLTALVVAAIIFIPRFLALIAG